MWVCPCTWGLLVPSASSCRSPPAWAQACQCPPLSLYPPLHAPPPHLAHAHPPSTHIPPQRTKTGRLKRRPASCHVQVVLPGAGGSVVGSCEAAQGGVGLLVIPVPCRLAGEALVAVSEAGEDGSLQPLFTFPLHTSGFQRCVGLAEWLSMAVVPRQLITPVGRQRGLRLEGDFAVYVCASSSPVVRVGCWGAFREVVVAVVAVVAVVVVVVVTVVPPPPSHKTGVPQRARASNDASATCPPKHISPSIPAFLPSLPPLPFPPTQSSPPPPHSSPRSARWCSRRVSPCPVPPTRAVASASSRGPPPRPPAASGAVVLWRGWTPRSLLPLRVGAPWPRLLQWWTRASRVRVEGPAADPCLAAQVPPALVPALVAALALQRPPGRAPVVTPTRRLPAALWRVP